MVSRNFIDTCQSIKFHLNWPETWLLNTNSKSLFRFVMVTCLINLFVAFIRNNWILNKVLLHIRKLWKKIGRTIEGAQFLALIEPSFQVDAEEGIEPQV